MNFLKAIRNAGISFTILIPVFSISYSKTMIKASPLRLRQHIEAIVNAEGYRNWSDTAALNRAALYIKSSFEDIGLQPKEQSFDYEGKRYKNIIAHVNPEKKKRIVIGAHYDVCGDQDGADDNASGVAGILETARHVQSNKNSIGYHVELVAYTLEEPPVYGTRFMGSYIHAESLHKKGIKPLLMISFEMIGYFSEEKNSQTYPVGFLKWFYPGTGDFIAAVANLGSRRYIRKLRRFFNKQRFIKMETLSAPEWFPGIGSSDHFNYWHFGFNAIMITDTAYQRNFHYHTKEDTIDKLDFTKMAQVVSGVANALIAGIW